MTVRLPRLLLVGYYGKGNFGDQLMLQELVSSLFGFEITVISYTECNFFLPGVKIVFNEKNKKRVSFLRYYNLFKVFLKCDVVIWGGGTCFYDNAKYGLVHLIGIVKIYFLARLLRIKIAFLGIGIGDIIHNHNRLITNYIISSSDLVTLRDSSSFDYLSKNSICGNIHKTGDFAFLYNRQDYNTPLSSNKIAFCGLSHYSMPSHEDNNIAINLARILDQLVEAGYFIDMVPMHLGLSWDDEVFNKLVFNFMKNKYRCHLVNISPINQVSETMQILSSSSAVVSMRYHGLIAGLLLGKMVYAISDNNKIISLMNDCGLQDDILSLNNLSSSVDASKRILKSISSQIVPSNFLESKRSEAYNNIELLKQIIVSKPSTN